MQFDRQEWKFDPIGELRDMVKNMDAVVDDFMMKKMGNGEVFVCVWRGGGVWTARHRYRLSVAFLIIHLPCSPFLPLPPSVYVVVDLQAKQ